MVRLAEEKRQEEREEKQRLARVEVEQNEQERISAEQAENAGGLSTRLSRKFVESEADIRAMTDTAHNMLDDAGIYESTGSIMEAMDEGLPKPLLDDNGINHQKYAEYVAYYVTVRKSGTSRRDAIDGLRFLTVQ